MKVQYAKAKFPLQAKLTFKYNPIFALAPRKQWMHSFELCNVLTATDVYTKIINLYRCHDPSSKPNLICPSDQYPLGEHIVCLHLYPKQLKTVPVCNHRKHIHLQQKFCSRHTLQRSSLSGLD